MIQRIQTVYMLLAVALTIACLCLQIGTYSALGLPILNEYNLWLTDPLGAHHFTVWPLFAVLVLSATIGLCTIFMFANRKLQSRMCALNMLLILCWYILYIVFSQTLTGIIPEEAAFTFRPAIAATFPCVASILYLMARKAIISDEKLVRAADRIR